MDISLVETIMENLGIEQSKIDLNKTDKSVPLPENIIKKFNINANNYTMYDFNNNENTDSKVWTFYQSILYFLKKDYLLESFNNMKKEYESFIIKFKHDIDRMCHVIDNNVEISTFEIDDKLLNILSRYLELKITILNSEEKINIYPDNNSKNKKILIFKNDNAYYPVADLRFQGYEFITDDMLIQEDKPSTEEKFVFCGLCNKITPISDKHKHDEKIDEKKLLKKSKEELMVTALSLGIQINKQGKTKVITKNKNELIIEIINHATKK